MSANDSFIEGVLIGLAGRRRNARHMRQDQRWDARYQRQGTRQQDRLADLMGRLGFGQGGRFGAPPALAELPDGGVAPVPGGSVAQGKVFPLGSTTLTAAGAGAIAGGLEVRGERAFRPTRLILFTTAASGAAVVSDISIGTQRQMANLETVPIEAFGATVTAALVDFDLIMPSTLVTIDVIWTATGAGSVNVSGMFYGTEL